MLFNVFISDLLQLYSQNNGTNKSAIAFADDLLIYVRGNKLSFVKTELQNLFNKIRDYLEVWKLQINPTKCKPIQAIY